MEITPNHVYFFISYAVAFIALGLIGRWYLWPAIAWREPRSALAPLLLYACLRVNGLMFLMPGLVAPSLPAAFAVPVAYGDVASAVLALIALGLLRARLAAAITAVWLFNIVGLCDLAYANISTFKDGVDPVQLGTAYYLAVINVPAMIVVHFIIFAYLLRRARTAGAS
ncbi:MAG TPA: hypothetical protein VKS60_06290 [Stellaceae bacterium]|nr:hypothetical protein [Stellaceae bacterium]